MIKEFIYEKNLYFNETVIAIINEYNCKSVRMTTKLKMYII